MYRNRFGSKYNIGDVLWSKSIQKIVKIREIIIRVSNNNDCIYDYKIKETVNTHQEDSFVTLEECELSVFKTLRSRRNAYSEFYNKTFLEQFITIEKEDIHNGDNP